MRRNLNVNEIDAYLLWVLGGIEDWSEVKFGFSQGEGANPRIEFLTASESMCVYAEKARQHEQMVLMDYVVLESLGINVLTGIHLQSYHDQAASTQKALIDPANPPAEVAPVTRKSSGLPEPEPLLK